MRKSLDERGQTRQSAEAGIEDADGWAHIFQSSLYEQRASGALARDARKSVHCPILLRYAFSSSSAAGDVHVPGRSYRQTPCQHCDCTNPDGRSGEAAGAISALMDGASWASCAALSTGMIGTFRWRCVYPPDAHHIAR